MLHIKKFRQHFCFLFFFYIRLRLVCVGGGVVDGLFDSIDIEPRVRFGALFGVLLLSPDDEFDDLRSISFDFKFEITFDVGNGFDNVADEADDNIFDDVLPPPFVPPP